MNDPHVETMVRRVFEDEAEAARQEAVGGVDLSHVKKQPKITGPNGEEMTLKEAVALAREVRKTAKRRRRAGKVPHGRQMAIPSKRAKFKTRRSA